MGCLKIEKDCDPMEGDLSAPAPASRVHTGHPDHNGVDRLSEINTPGVGSRSFDYDEVSNINQVKYESGQFDYAYDQNSALIGAYYKGGEGIKDERFVWDNSGNRMNGTRDPASNSIRPRPILINNGLFEDAEPMTTTTSSIGRYSFIYDMHGNVVKKFDNEANIYYVFEYDADNKLVYAEKYNNDSLELKAKYFYDGLGRRAEKEVTKGSTVTRKSYVYNGENILLEYNTSGATPVETAKYIGSGAIDDNLMTIKGGKGYFYHKDHLGSITAISNDVGEVVQKNQYSSFGKIVSIKDKERREIAPVIDQPFYYTGREWDEELELYYYRARSFDPVQGRFMQKDPIGLNGGDTNLYRYSLNDSINRVDPDGKDSYIVSQFGHEYLVIDNPNGGGGTIAYDFFPNDGRLEGLVNAVPAEVRRQNFEPGEAPWASFEVPFTRVTQDRNADIATINRVKELENLARTGELRYNAFQARENTLNCAGFAGAPQ